MKKEYIIPSLEIVMVQTQQVLAVSNRGFSNTDATTDGNGNYGDAHGFDFDDEEE